MFAVRQANENNTVPFKVEVSESQITNAVDSGILFYNIGGELTLEDINLDASTVEYFVATGSAAANEGSTFLRRVTVANSNIIVRVGVLLQTELIPIPLTSLPPRFLCIGRVCGVCGCGHRRH